MIKEAEIKPTPNPSRGVSYYDVHPREHMLDRIGAIVVPVAIIVLYVGSVVLAIVYCL